MHKQIPSEKRFMTEIKRHYHETRPVAQHQSSSPILGCLKMNVNPGSASILPFQNFPQSFFSLPLFARITQQVLETLQDGMNE